MSSEKRKLHDDKLHEAENAPKKVKTSEKVGLSKEDRSLLLDKLTEYVSVPSKHKKAVEAITKALNEGILLSEDSEKWCKLLKQAYLFWLSTISESLKIKLDSLYDEPTEREVEALHLPRALPMITNQTKDILIASLSLFEEAKKHSELLPKIENKVLPQIIFDEQEAQIESDVIYSLSSFHASLFSTLISTTHILLAPDSFELGKGTAIIRDRVERIGINTQIARLRKARAREIIEAKKEHPSAENEQIISELLPFTEEPSHIVPYHARKGLFAPLYCVALISRDLLRVVWAKNEALNFLTSIASAKDGLLEHEKEQILVWNDEIRTGNTGTGGLLMCFGRNEPNQTEKVDTFSKIETRWRNADIAKGKNQL